MKIRMCRTVVGILVLRFLFWAHLKDEANPKGGWWLRIENCTFSRKELSVEIVINDGNDSDSDIEEPLSVEDIVDIPQEPLQQTCKAASCWNYSSLHVPPKIPRNIWLEWFWPVLSEAGARGEDASCRWTAVVQALGHLISSLTYVFGSVSKKPRSVLAPKVPTYFAGGELSEVGTGGFQDVWCKRCNETIILLPFFDFLDQLFGGLML